MYLTHIFVSLINQFMIILLTQLTGFAEAVVNFTDNFVEEDSSKVKEFPFRDVHTTKQLHVYILVESAKFIIGIGLNKEKCASENYILHTPTIRKVIATAYLMFRLFFGRFSDLSNRSLQLLKERFEYFFPRYLYLLRLSKMPLLDLFHGIDILALDSLNYLRVETLVSRVIESFPKITKYMFFYHEKLISYTVPKQDVAILFRYITQNILSTSMRAELQPESELFTSNKRHKGRFLTGVSDVSADTIILSAKESELPLVYLSNGDSQGDSLNQYQLIVYRALNATFCMFVCIDEDVTFLQQLDDELGPELSILASQIGESFDDSAYMPQKEIDFHFIYYNPVSLSIKSTFVGPLGFSDVNLPAMPLSLYKICCEIVDTFLSSDESGELTLKTESNWCVAAKQLNDRYLIIFTCVQATSSVAEFSQNVNNIIKTHFSSFLI